MDQIIIVVGWEHSCHGWPAANNKNSLKTAVNDKQVHAEVRKKPETTFRDLMPGLTDNCGRMGT